MRSAMPRLVALAIIPFSIYGCSKKQADPPQPKPTEAAVIPAPKGLVAELVLPNPGETWAKVRTAMGGPLTMLPAHGGVLATTAFDLPPTAAELFDVNLPAVGAVIEDEGRYAAVLAFHVKDGPKLAELATTGDYGRYVKKPDAESGIVLLEPKEAVPGPALGVAGNYLTVASRSSDLTRFAPFVTKVLSTRPAPKEDVVALVPPKSLTHITSLLKEQWEAMSSQVTLSFSNGSKILDKVNYVFDYMSSLEDGRIALSLEDGLAHVLVEATYKAGSKQGEALAKAPKGDAKALLELPAQSVIAVLFRENKEARHEAVTEGLAALEGIEPAQKQKIDEVLRAFADSRGETVTVGVIRKNDKFAFVAKGQVENEEAFKKAVPELLKTLQVPGVAQSVETFIGPFQLEKTSAQGAVHSARLTRKTAPTTTFVRIDPESLPTQLDIVWEVRDSAFFAAADNSKDVKKTLTAIKGAESKLADTPHVAKLVNDLQGDVAFAFLINFHGVDDATDKPNPDKAPVLFTAGRLEGNKGFVRLDMPQSGLRDIAMMASGL